MKLYRIQYYIAHAGVFDSSPKTVYVTADSMFEAIERCRKQYEWKDNRFVAVAIRYLEDFLP